ncbi:MAG: hybrid sensor histidine kinase/response regulator [Elainellaceae cyanobacterium]
MTQQQAIEQLFAGDSAMAVLMRSLDWAQTPLGDVETWCPSLKTAIGILLNADSPMFLVWESDRILFYNDACASVFNQTNHLAAVGSSVNENWSDDWSSVWSNVEQVFNTGQPLQHQHQPVAAHQNAINTSIYSWPERTWSYSAIWNGTGQIGGVFAISSLKSTGYKQSEEVSQEPNRLEHVNATLQNTLEDLLVTEEELRQQNQELVAARQIAEIEGQRYQSLFNFAPHGYVVTDADGTIQEANRAIAALVASSQSYLIGKPLTTLISDSDRRAFRTLFTALLHQPQTQQLQTDKLSLKHPDGHLIPVAVTGDSICNPHGHVSGIRWLIQDITSRKQTEQSLRRSEDRLCMAVESAHLGIWDWNLLTNQLTWDARCKAMFGLSPNASVTIEIFFAGLHPEDRNRVEQVIQEILNPDNEGHYDIDYRVIGIEDGIERWLSAKGHVYFEADGTPRRFTGMVQDITDRKRAEAILRDREQRLDIATQAAQLGIFEWDIQSDHAVWENQRMYDIFGHTLEDGTLNNAQFLEHAVHPDDREAFEQRLTEGIRSNRLQQVVCRIRRRNDGQWRWIEVTGHVSSTPDGHPCRLVGVISDITDRKRFEHELMESEAIATIKAGELAALMEATPAAIWIAHDPQCHHMTANRMAYELMKLEPGSITTATAIDGSNPLPFWQRKNGQDIAPHDLPMQKAIRTKQEVVDEIEFAFPDGTVRYIYGKAVPLYDSIGTVRGAIGGFVEITSLKESEREREQLLERERLAREDAERANRIKDEFLAILSHELRSPLNPILGWSKLLQTRKFDETVTTKALATIERNARLQTQLIDDLLDVGKILRGKLKLQSVPVNLADVIEAATETVKAAADAKSIAICPVLLDIGQVRGDSTRLQQIIWNLLSNAIKFTPNGGQVIIRLEQTRNQAQITVTDTGKGITPDFLPHIFESFRQEDASITRQYGGLGLGLAIVRYLTEAHGGTVAAHSPGEGLGAIFTVCLPLIQSEPDINQKRESLQPNFDLTGLRILTIDDDLDTRELLKILLTQYGANVLTVASAVEVLEALETFRPHVLINDIGMPEVDGYTLIQLIRALPPEKGGKIPAIALTAYAGEDDYQHAMTSGYQQHVAKPFDSDQLFQAVLTLAKNYS